MAPFDHAFSAQVANVTYQVASRDYGRPAYVEVQGLRGGLKRLDLGHYVKIEQAQQAKISTPVPSAPSFS